LAVRGDGEVAWAGAGGRLDVLARSGHDPGRGVVVPDPDQVGPQVGSQGELPSRVEERAVGVRLLLSVLVRTGTVELYEGHLVMLQLPVLADGDDLRAAAAVVRHDDVLAVRVHRDVARPGAAAERLVELLQLAGLRVER